MNEEVVLATAVILALGVVAHWVGWRLRVPSIVFLLAAGLLIGPVTGLLQPDDILGDALFPVVSMAVAVILFEGALGLGVKGIREAGTTVVMLLTLGAGITLAATAVTARVVFDVDWSLAWLLASVLVVTGPTVVGPLVRAIGLHGRVASILEAEGTLIDPIGAILAAVLFGVFFEPEAAGAWPMEIFLTLFVGAVAGGLGALLITFTFSRYLVPDQLHNVMTLAVVLTVLAIADHLQPEAGLVAVTLMGVGVATQERESVEGVLEFNETLRTLFIAGLFILLGARIAPETLSNLGWKNVLFLLVLIAIVRPLAVFASTIRSDLNLGERTFIALTAPRGIVAAAIASIFSLRLVEDGFEGDQILVAATFTVIAGTVLFSGAVSRPLTRRLGLVDDSSFRAVVLGSNRMARELAHVLAREDIDVTLVGMDRRNLTSARMDGLTTHYGSVVDDETWDGVEVGQSDVFLAMSSQEEINALATRRAAQLIGRRNVFQLVPRSRSRSVPATRGVFGRPLFSKRATVELLESRLDDGWMVSATKLTDEFRAKDYFSEHPAALVLGAKRRGALLMHDAGQRIALRRGDTVISLVPARDRDEREARRQRSRENRGERAPGTYTQRLAQAQESRDASERPDG